MPPGRQRCLNHRCASWPTKPRPCRRECFPPKRGEVATRADRTTPSGSPDWHHGRGSNRKSPGRTIQASEDASDRCDQWSTRLPFPTRNKPDPSSRPRHKSLHRGHNGAGDCRAGPAKRRADDRSAQRRLRCWLPGDRILEARQTRQWGGVSRNEQTQREETQKRGNLDAGKCPAQRPGNSAPGSRIDVSNREDDCRKRGPSRQSGGGEQAGMEE